MGKHTDRSHKPGPPMPLAEAKRIKTIEDKANKLIREKRLKNGEGFELLNDIYLV